MSSKKPTPSSKIIKKKGPTRPSNKKNIAGRQCRMSRSGSTKTKDGEEAIYLCQSIVKKPGSTKTKDGDGTSSGGPKAKK